MSLVIGAIRAAKSSRISWCLNISIITSTCRELPVGLTKLVASIAVHGMRAKECERIDVLRGKSVTICAFGRAWRNVIGVACCMTRRCADLVFGTARMPSQAMSLGPVRNSRACRGKYQPTSRDVRAHVARKQNWTACCHRMSLTRRTSPGIIRAIQVNLAREVLCQSERVFFCSSKLVYCLAPPHLFGPSNR